jgi:hypothetical protein
VIEADVSLYLASRARLARVQKVVAFAALPRLREHVKIRNCELGDYFAFSVMQVTHREGARPELWLHLTQWSNGRLVVDFIEDGELNEYVASYQQEGWALASLVPNRTFRGTGESIWSELVGEADPDIGTDRPGE